MTRSRERLLGLLPACMAGIVYAPILGEYFKRDDFLHLFEIVNYGALEFLFTPHGGHLLTSSNLAWIVCFESFGLNAAGYQTVAWLTHMLNVWLLYQTIVHLTDRPALAVFGASLWGMAPMAYGSVAWFSVYGHVLVGTAISAILFDVTRLSRDRVAPTAGRKALWYALFLVAATSFGVGLGTAAASGLILWLMRPGEVDRNRVAWTFGSLAVVIPILYEVQHRAFRALTGVETLRPEVSLAHWGAYLFVQLDLLVVAIGSLLLGPWASTERGRLVYGSLAGSPAESLMPVYWVLAALVTAGVLWVSFRSPPDTRFRIAGLVLVAASAYGVITLGRGFFAGQKPLLNPGNVNRYHYIGTLALTAGGCLALGYPLERLRGRVGRTAAIALVAAWAVVSVPLFRSAILAHDQSRAEKFRAGHERVMQFVEERAAAAPEGADVYLHNIAFPIPLVTAQVFPRAAALFVVSDDDLEVAGRRIFFVETDPSVLEAVRAHPDCKLARILVAPDDVPDAVRGNRWR